jgi:hypothetical protein
LWWVGVDGDLEVDLDAPAGDGDFLDDEAEEFLAGVEVELVDGGADSLREAGDGVLESLVLREFGLSRP